MTNSELELLHAAGILELVASGGGVREYRIARGAECLLGGVPKLDPTPENRPDWAYVPDELENKPPMLTLVKA